MSPAPSAIKNRDGCAPSADNHAFRVARKRRRAGIYCKICLSARTLFVLIWITPTWASSRLLDAAAQLSPEELTRDFGTADKSVVGTLAHVFAADRVWMARIQGQPPAKFITDEDRDLSLLQREWPALLEVVAGVGGGPDGRKRHAGGLVSGFEGQRLDHAVVEDRPARGESRHASSGTGFRVPAGDGARAAAAGFDRVLPDVRLSAAR